MRGLLSVLLNANESHPQLDVKARLVLNNVTILVFSRAVAGWGLILRLHRVYFIYSHSDR